MSNINTPGATAPDVREPPSVFFGVCALAACTMFTYGISGAAGQALFVNTYGSDALPKVWLAVAGCSLGTVALMNWFSARYDVVKLYFGSAHVSAILLVVLMAAHMADIPGTAFALYVWKDIYIVVLVELFWTFSNVAFGIRTASRTYGLYCAAGSLGNILGSLGMKPLVAWMGTFHSMWLIVPLLWASAWGCKRLGRDLTLPEPSSKRGQKPDSWREGARVINKSHYLGLLLVVVAVVQVVITITDFQFNEAVELAYPDPDGRTLVFSYVNAFIAFASFVLQIGTGLILGKLGVQGVLIMVPSLIGLSLTAFVVAPGFASMAIAKTLGKTLDYSLFRAAKEILYIPLTYAEKTQGKALIDMLTYRVAKGAVSLLLMVVARFALQPYLGGLNASLCALWLGLSWFILKRYRTLKAA